MKHVVGYTLAFLVGASCAFWFFIFLGLPHLPPSTSNSPQNGLGNVVQTQKVQSTIPPVKTHVGPDYLYPNSKLTPGKYETLNRNDIVKLYNGLTYSQSHRDVTDATKKQVCKEYGVICKTGAQEIDHFYPVCAGASNDISNLWPEPAVSMWGGQDYSFHTKDKLEAQVCRGIKNGTIDPKEAFQKITEDWVAYYLELNP